MRDANLRVNWLMLLEILFSFFSISQCFDANIWHAYPTPCEAIRKEKPDVCSDLTFFFGDVLEYVDNRAFFISMAANGQKWLMNESAVPDDF